MKNLVVLAIILAVLGVGCVIAELFVHGIANIWLTIATCILLAAFIITFVAFANKSSE